MTQDATSQPSDTTSATEDDQAQQLLVDAADTADDTGEANTEPAKPEPDKAADDKLGDSGKRALNSEREARREAEKATKELADRLKLYEDRDKTELQKAVERAEAAEKGASSMRIANTRLMAAATYNIPPDLIDLLGDGTDEEIDAKAKLLASKLAAAPAPAKDPEPKQAPAQRRPVESLTPGAKPANETPTDPNDAFRNFVNSRRT